MFEVEWPRVVVCVCVCVCVSVFVTVIQLVLCFETYMSRGRQLCFNE
jgi:hypothetical protein